MFVDIAKVRIKSGKGGDGVVSFRHEKFIDKGGPDGGDGGRGGDVIFRADGGLNTLLKFRYKPELTAEDGKAGSKQNKRGRSGESSIIDVPIGTVVYKNGQIIADFISDKQEIVIAKGGDGGFGNAHFKSSVRQTPRMAELGEKGEVFEADLELKLLADVGLVGFPNAGKSTLLSVVSNARPEIADYEFTTLVPNLGVADIDDGSILIADIPGLIEGASDGRGLGDQFLRHVERTAVLLHMIDIYNDDLVQKYQTIRQELQKYSQLLAEKSEIIALTKCEGLDDELIKMQTDQLQKIAPKVKIIHISSQTGLNIKELLRALRQEVNLYRQAEKLQMEEALEDDELAVISLSDEQIKESWAVICEDQQFRVTGDKIEKFARRTNFEQHEAVNRLRDIMRKMGIFHELARQGAVGDSVILIGEDTFTLLEQ